MTAAAALQALPNVIKADRALLLIFISLIAQLRLAQIEFALDLRPCFVGELASAEKLIGPLPLGADHQEFDFGVQVGKPLMPIDALSVRDMSEPDSVLSADGSHYALWKPPLRGKLVEPG
jgi:hypothetical protein